MGDLHRRVTLCALSTEGRRGTCRDYTALIDTGSTRTVIPRDVLDELGARPLLDVTMPLGRRRYPAVLLSVQLGAPHCAETAAVAIVSTEHARKAGPGARIILGHDYLQHAEATLAFTAPRHRVSCPKSGRRRRR